MAVIVVGVFPSRDQAEAAVRELHDQGFDSANVGLVLPGRVTRAARAALTRGAGSFAWIPDHRGIVFAGIGQAEVAGTIGQCAGQQTPTTGAFDLTRALTCLGIEESHAAWYNQQVQQGYSLVTVFTADRAGEAESIMRRFGSIEIPGTERRPAQAPGLPTGLGRAAAGVPGDLSKVRRGFDVYTSDGQLVGTVQEASPSCVHVISCSSLFVPPYRVERVTSNSVVLAVPASELASLDWSACQPEQGTEYQPGGPGFTGLPPQEHEGGVSIPIETEER